MPNIHSFVSQGFLTYNLTGKIQGKIAQLNADVFYSYLCFPTGGSNHNCNYTQCCLSVFLACCRTLTLCGEQTWKWSWPNLHSQPSFTNQNDGFAPKLSQKTFLAWPFSYEKFNSGWCAKTTEADLCSATVCSNLTLCRNFKREVPCCNKPLSKEPL